MEPWGIIMTVGTMVGMLGLLVASVRMDGGFVNRESTALPDEPATQPAAIEFKKAA
jgi:hypothetical protein